MNSSSAANNSARRAGWPPWWIALGTLGAPVVIAALALWMVPGSRRFLKVMLEPKIAWVAEHMPVSLAQYWGNLGWPGILAFAAPAAVLAFRARGRDRLPALFASLAATLLLLEWIRVRDYEYLAPPLSAFAAAVVLHAAFGRSPGLDVARRRAAAAGVAVVLAALPVWPLGLHPSPFLTEPVLRSLIILTDGWGQAMGWMAAHTPEPTLPVDVRVAAFDDFHYPAGTYGVLNAWDYGNFVSALGRRPTVVSQGVSRPAAEWLVAGSEADGLASWQSLMQPGESVRYAVIGAPTVSDHVASTFAFLGRSPSDLIERAGQGQMMRYGEQFTTTLMWRLYGEAGSGLARHRLVYQSPHRSLLFYRGRSAGPDGRPSLQLRSLPMDRADAVQLHAELVRRGVLHTVDGTMYAPVVLPTVRIFEIVAGARIAGRAAPGATVEVGLPLRSRSDGYEWVYVQLAVADGDGRFEVTVPYATEPAPISDVVALDRYRVRVTDARKHSSARFLEVSERAVQAGDRLDLGLLP